MKSAVFLLMVATALGSPRPAATSQSSTTATAPFYALVGTATAQTPNAAPVLGSSAELILYNADSIAASVAAAVTDVATPLSKRGAGLDADLDLCIVVLGMQIPAGCAESAGHYTTTKSTKPATTSAATCKTKTANAMTTTAPASTPTSVYASVPSTCTPTGWVNTNTYTSIAACATAIEVGTYCGFINPEDPCAPQLSGSAPSPSVDSAAAFLANSAYKSLATKAATPSGYTSTFTNWQAAVQGNTYLGYKTLSSYDTATCAAYCDATDLCTGFNVFIERDPSWNPDECSCADPPANYNVKCSIFAGGVYSSAATNAGQYQDDFEVAIAASNGYMKSDCMASGGDDGELCLPSGCRQPHSCWGKTHHHPETCLKEAFFPGAFNVDLCLGLAAVQSQTNMAAGVNATAAFLNAALIERDGVGWGTWCGLFTEPYGSDDCDWSPGASGGHSWGCQDSWGIGIDIDVFLLGRYD